MPCSSFKQGMTTVMRSSLYTQQESAQSGRANLTLYGLAGYRGGEILAEYDEGVIWTVLCLALIQQPQPAAAPAPAATPAIPPPVDAGPHVDGGDDLLQIRSVYLLKMSRAFDQYLATHLTRGGTLQVVTDPQKADGILTDQLGRQFEDEMEELYPRPKAPDPLPAAKEDEEEKPSSAVMLEMRDPEGRPRSTFGRGRGTVFLVHRASGNVVWSTYLRPKSPTADVLNDAARQVADQIKDAFKKRQNAFSKRASGGK